MFEYNVKIKKVSGRLNESVLPQKNLVVKSKSELSIRKVLKEAAKYLLENYGLELGDAEVKKPVRKAPLQKEQFTIEDLKKLCKFNGREYEYRGYRTTPDGRKYELMVSSAATGGRKIWVWAAGPSISLSSKAVALYDTKTNTWQKKRNNFINIVD